MAPNFRCHTLPSKLPDFSPETVWHRPKSKDCAAGGRAAYIASPPHHGHPSHSAYRWPNRIEHKRPKNRGAIRLRRRFPRLCATSYGSRPSVPYEIPQLNQPHKGQGLALLLSCPPHSTPTYSPEFRQTTPPSGIRSLP